MSEKISASELAYEDAKNLFDLVDTNHNGTIDFEEMTVYLLSKNPKMTENDIRVIMARIDTNEDGNITFPEFFLSLHSYLENDEEEEDENLLEIYKTNLGDMYISLENSFKSIDSDDSKSIDKNEFFTFIKEQVSSVDNEVEKIKILQEFEQQWSTFDSNKDDKISFLEFLTAYSSIMPNNKEELQEPINLKPDPVNFKLDASGNFIQRQTSINNLETMSSLRLAVERYQNRFQKEENLKILAQKEATKLYYQTENLSQELEELNRSSKTEIDNLKALIKDLNSNNRYLEEENNESSHSIERFKQIISEKTKIIEENKLELKKLGDINNNLFEENEKLRQQTKDDESSSQSLETKAKKSKIISKIIRAYSKNQKQNFTDQINNLESHISNLDQELLISKCENEYLQKIPENDSNTSFSLEEIFFDNSNSIENPLCLEEIQNQNDSLQEIINNKDNEILQLQQRLKDIQTQNSSPHQEKNDSEESLRLFQTIKQLQNDSENTQIKLQQLTKTYCNIQNESQSTIATLEKHNSKLLAFIETQNDYIQHLEQIIS